MSSVVGLSVVTASPAIGTSVTVMATVSGLPASPRLSVTARRKVSTVGVAGAVKVGDRVSAAFKTTDSPAVCVHRCTSGRWPSGSETLPANVNSWLTRPDWSGPAFATGGWLVTVTCVLATTWLTPLVAVTTAV